MITIACASGKSSVIETSICARHPFGVSLRAAGRRRPSSYGRLARRKVDHAHIPPEHAPAETRCRAPWRRLPWPRTAWRRTRRAIGGRRICRRSMSGEDTVREIVAITLDACARCAGCRWCRCPGPMIMRTSALFASGAEPASASAPSSAPRARPRPVKIASPTRKWPIFSSTTCGIAAISPTVSKVMPWPAWTSSPSRCGNSPPPLRAGRVPLRRGRIFCQRGFAITAGMQLHDIRAGHGGRFDLRCIGVDEQRHANAGILLSRTI